MTLRHDPMTLGQLDAHLRAMLGHLTRRDRAVVLEACEALTELAHRLQQTTVTGVDPGASTEERERLLQPRPSRRQTETEQVEHAILDPRRYRGSERRALSRPEDGTCGQPCRTHDECVLPCQQPYGHALAETCDCGLTAEFPCQRPTPVGVCGKRKEDPVHDGDYAGSHEYRPEL